MTAEESLFQPSITKEEISRLVPEVFKGKIIIVDSADQVDQAVNELQKESIIGFDTETRPSFTKGKQYSVSLLQLATTEKCFLFRLNKIGFPPTLLQLLSDPCIEKIGLSLKDDFGALQKIQTFQPMGFKDLQYEIKQWGITDQSLQKIYAIIFGKKISKAQRLTNWEAGTLLESQQIYAATDAWATLSIYLKINKFPKTNPLPLMEKKPKSPRTSLKKRPICKN